MSESGDFYCQAEELEECLCRLCRKNYKGCGCIECMLDGGGCCAITECCDFEKE